MGSEHFILPVRTGISLINIMLVGMTIFIVEVSRIGTFLTGIFILHQYKFIRVHHVQFIGECFTRPSVGFLVDTKITPLAPRAP